MKSFFYLQRSDRRTILAILAVIVAAVGLTIYLGGGGNTATAIGGDTTAVADGKRNLDRKGGQAYGYYDTGENRRSSSPSTRTRPTAPNCCASASPHGR